MRVDDLRPLGIFDGVTDEQLGQLLDAGTEVAVEPGVDLFREGAQADFWWVLVDGAVELVRQTGREETVVAKMDVPGRWAGGFRAWDEHGVYLATGRGAAPGRVLRVPAANLGELAREWFPFGSQLIRGLYHTARSIESTVRQRESLVSLGTLAAGLAHELNNPAAAATRAVSALEAASEGVLSSLDRLAQQEISFEQFLALDGLRRELGTRPVDPDPLARADREQDLSSWLESHGVTNAWSIAPPLAAAGADPVWSERASTVLEGSALEPAFAWVASTFSVATLLAEVKESTRRISDLVATVKSYSQMDRASMQRIDVTEGLESTLSMLGHKLGAGTEVVRTYGSDVPEIGAYAGELNQVWTNLIENAVDAMEGVGTLTLRTRWDAGAVVVEVGDTGAGMTPEVAERAFDPFFTTKDVGRGTGLGLDIARRIVVERHGGSITVDSRPGRTTVSVRLPAG